MATERRLGPWEAVRRSAPLPAAGFVGRGGRSATVTRPPVSSRPAEGGGDRKAWDPGRRYGIARRWPRRSLCDRHETPCQQPRGRGRWRPKGLGPWEAVRRSAPLVEEVALRPSRDPLSAAARPRVMATERRFGRREAVRRS